MKESIHLEHHQPWLIHATTRYRKSALQMFRDFVLEGMSFAHALVILYLNLDKASVLFKIELQAFMLFEPTDQTGGVEVDLEGH